MKQSVSDASRTRRIEEPERASRRVVEAVAEAEGVDPTDLEPLYGTVDPDALDTLLQPRVDAAGDPPVEEVKLRYQGHEVRITASGRVELADK